MFCSSKGFISPSSDWLWNWNIDQAISIHSWSDNFHRFLTHSHLFYMLLQKMSNCHKSGSIFLDIIAHGLYLLLTHPLLHHLSLREFCKPFFSVPSLPSQTLLTTLLKPKKLQSQPVIKCQAFPKEQEKKGVQGSKIKQTKNPTLDYQYAYFPSLHCSLASKSFLGFTPPWGQKSIQARSPGSWHTASLYGLANPCRCLHPSPPQSGMRW